MTVWVQQESGCVPKCRCIMDMEDGRLCIFSESGLVGPCIWPGPTHGRHAAQVRSPCPYQVWAFQQNVWIIWVLMQFHMWQPVCTNSYGTSLVLSWECTTLQLVLPVTWMLLLSSNHPLTCPFWLFLAECLWCSPHVLVLWGCDHEITTIVSACTKLMWKCILIENFNSGLYKQGDGNAEHYSHGCYASCRCVSPCGWGIWGRPCNCVWALFDLSSHPLYLFPCTQCIQLQCHQSLTQSIKVTATHWCWFNHIPTTQCAAEQWNHKACLSSEAIPWLHPPPCQKMSVRSLLIFLWNLSVMPTGDAPSHSRSERTSSSIGKKFVTTFFARFECTCHSNGILIAFEMQKVPLQYASICSHTVLWGGAGVMNYKLKGPGWIAQECCLMTSSEWHWI